jgi:hypothetical protein
MLVLVVFATYWVAGFTYKKIELPFIELSKQFVKKFSIIQN